jgi:hypothetical protein
MLDILRAASPRFCDQFVQELKEPTAVDGPFVVRASPKNKEEVGEVFLASIEVERAVVLQ